MPILYYLNILAAAMFLLAGSSSTAAAIEDPGTQLSKIGVDNKISAQINLDLEFTDSGGQTRKLRDILIPGKPVIFTPVYYTCPRLCGLLLTGVVKLLNDMQLEMGQEYQLLTVSFDDTEGFELAKERADEYQTRVKNSDIAKTAWHFLVGSKENVSELMSTAGFRYMKDKDEFAHAAAIIILTPQGEISQYFTGIEFSPWDVRLSLIDASQGRVGSFVDQLLLFCFRYDHMQGKYTLAAFNLVRAGGLLTMFFLGIVVLRSSRAKARQG